MKHPTRRRGLTLVEVLVSMVVLSMTTLSAVALLPFCAQMRDSSGNFSRGAALVQRKLEQIRDLELSQVTAGGLAAAGVIDPLTGSDSGVYSFTSIDRLTSELNSGDGVVALSGVGSDLVTVTVTVAWRDRRGVRSSSSATTYVSSKELWREP
jgi:prepilin-type N-terminal cleavage/methylation domain-containing protein